MQFTEEQLLIRDMAKVSPKNKSSLMPVIGIEMELFQKKL